MKKIFVNEDGTIKLITVVYSILILLFIILLIMFIITKFSSKMTNDNDDERITTTTKTTTTMKLCQDCNLSFIRDEYTMKTNEKINISDLLELKSINIKNVKFSEYDESLIEITTSKKEVVIKALNKLGTTKIKAEYQNKETEITIHIYSDYITSAKLLNENYYAYVDETNKIVIETDPENVEVSFFNITVDDENIASISNGNIIGKNLGVTNINLDYNGITSKSKLYVIKSRIAIYIMSNNEMIEYSSYKTNIKSFNIIVKSLDKDITKEDLTFNFNGGNITYVEPHLEEPNAFIYSVDLNDLGNYDLEFILSDGSKTGMNIIYE